jgi:hypothetical protein
VEALVHATCLGLSSGFYVWILGDPQPAGHAILKLTQPNLLAGLPKALLVSLVGAIVAAKMLGVSEAMRTWRGRLALGLCPLYMATTSAAIGHLAVMCAPATALVDSSSRDQG